MARVERLKDEVRRLDVIEKDMDKHRQVELVFFCCEVLQIRITLIIIFWYAYSSGWSRV